MAKKCRINVIIFGKVLCKCSVHNLSQVHVFIKWRPYSELILHALSGLSKYYVNQNDELTLPHPIYRRVGSTSYLRTSVIELNQIRMI